MYAYDDTKSLDPHLLLPPSYINTKIFFDELVDSRTKKTVRDTMHCIREYFHERMSYEEIFE